ncbi:MAG TPA: outer membrane protein assembly factor BamB [Thiobacillaceae bacterium]|nr:outer membrane protein assembly factor BamB [Thiobacillaceae bacterium]
MKPFHRMALASGRSAVLLALVAAMAGCSFWGGGDAKPKPVDLGANVPVLGVRQAWVAKIGAMQGMSLVVDVRGTAINLASADGVVVGIDARTGGDLWRVSLGEPLAAGVGSDGKWSAVVSRGNEVIVLEAGRELWRRRLASQVYTAPLVAGARVFVLGADRSIVAFDAKSGQRLWSQSRPGEPLVLRQPGILTAVGDTLIAGLSGRLVGLNPDTGTVRWEAPLASPRGTNDVERLVELVAPFSRVDGSVCARAFQAAVGCVNAARGSVDWVQKANGGQGIHGNDAVLFGTESNGVVVSWRRADGARLWTSERLQYRKLTAPLLLGRSVVIGDDAGLVHLLSRDDGAPLNRMQTDGSGIAATPVVAADTMVVVTRNGNVYGYRPD